MGPEGAVEHHLQARHRRLADARGAPRAPRGRLPRALRQPVLRRRARLRRRRHRPARDAAEGHRRARRAADQARERRRSASTATSRCRRARAPDRAGAGARVRRRRGAALRDARRRRACGTTRRSPRSCCGWTSRGLLHAIPDSESTPPLYYVLALAVDARLRHRRGRPAVAVGAARDGDDPRRLGARPAARRRPRRRSSRRRSSPSTRCSCGSARRRARTRCSSLLAALSALLWLRALEQPRAGRAAAWGVVAALALATHYYAIFLVAPAGAVARRCARRALRARAAALAPLGARARRARAARARPARERQRRVHPRQRAR